jgi:hypothetical protein
MTKDIYHIKQLLSAYYDGMSTAAQDAELVEYFRNTPVEEVPEEMLADRKVVLAVADEGACDIPADLRDSLSSQIDSLAADERRSRRRSRFAVVSGIAASFAILLGAAMYVINNTSASVYELTDPEEAQIEAQRAIMLVSECLNEADRRAEDSDVLMQNLGFDISLFDDDSDELDDSLGGYDFVPAGEISDTIGV